MILDSSDVVLLESTKCDDENFTSFLFLEPIEKLVIFSIDDVPDLFDRIERQLEHGYHVAGYFSYECGFHFERFSSLPPAVTPIAWFGVYRQPFVFNHRSGVLSPSGLNVDASHIGSSASIEESRISELHLAITPEDYAKVVDRIQQHIRSGDTYQINFTTKYEFTFAGSPLALYRSLKREMRVPYSAYIRNDSQTVVCCSPELFFRRTGNSIITKPMKGTVRRGKTNSEDEVLKEWLRNDQKNRSENTMIVDLLRNDIGKISATGSVEPCDMFKVESFGSLLQMTSTIRGTLRPDVRYFDVFRSLFPCGSVTGAPKISSMNIISELEGRRRGVYTGAIGYFAPNAAATFNVAIRTVVVDGSKGEMGVGGGIIADSRAEDEFAECQLKAHFLNTSREECALLETLLWDGGYPFLDQHLSRLQDSSRYFDFSLDEAAVRIQLEDRARQFASGVKYRVRLTLDEDGRTSIEHAVLNDADLERPRVMLSDVRTNSGDKFLYHKTTRRHIYDESHHRALHDGLADVLFMNERGEITEGAISNIFIRRGGTLRTPMLASGLLNGIYRRHVLRSNPTAHEQVLYPDDLLRADALYICNAVRGMREVQLL